MKTRHEKKDLSGLSVVGFKSIYHGVFRKVMSLFGSV